jgi:enoyl-CoA hydratase/carnithine racemase
MTAAPAVGLRTTPTQAPVLREDARDVVVLTLNRAEERNTLSTNMISALRDAFASIATDERVRAVVLAANGPAFSAGHDLKEVASHRSDADAGRAYMAALMESCSALMLAITRLPQPVIAAVEGIATAAGCQLVATCDLAVASSNAKFCTPGVHIGLFCSTPMVALSRNVGRKQAMEMLLTGDMVSADEACRIGLVNRVVQGSTAREEALALAGKVASKSATVVKLGKEAFYRQIEMDLPDAYAYASQVMVTNMLARDAGEGIAAFVEKRAPKWEDR